MNRLHTLLAALCLAPALALAQSSLSQPEGRLQKIAQSQTITLAYRTDAIPFSFEDKDKKPVGYTVDLCTGIVSVLAGQLGVPQLKVNWVPVTAQSRFAAIASGQADLECGASTVTLGRMKEVGFSSLIFLDGTGLIVRQATAANSLRELGNKKIGVISGTSNEAALETAMKSLAVPATVVKVKTRDEGLAQLEAGVIDAFAGDRVLLIGLAAKSAAPKGLALLTDALSYEPYAIALPRGDWALQQAVNSALAKIYKSAALPAIYDKWFADLGRPSAALEMMYGLGQLPE
jgi:glutamate/aspartate transport system substrate-binding protein